MKYKKQIMIFFAALALALGAFNSQASFKQTVTLENENLISEQIPLNFDSPCPNVEIEIDGKKIHLLVDTGADSVTFALKTSTLETLQVNYLNKHELSRDVTGKFYRSRRFIIPSAKLGNLQFLNLTATEENRGFIQQDGIIGNELLRHFYVLFDYSAAVMTLYPKTIYPAELGLENWTKVPYLHNNIGIVINGRLGPQGKKLKFCLDTGCRVELQGEELGLIRSKHVPKSERKGLIKIPDFSKGKYSVTQTANFYIEDFDLGNLKFLVNDFKQPSVDGFLGQNVFLKYKILIDFDNHLLFMK